MSPARPDAPATPDSRAAGARQLRIGTRGSRLALVQTGLARQALEGAWPGLEVHVQTIVTKGDVVLDRPIEAVSGSAIFIREIEDAMRSGVVDIAVHSAKDLPAILPADMTLGACLPRADARDVVVSRAGPLSALPVGARVGSSSPRRACQLRALRPDLEVADIRGNVETRLAKLEAGQFHAIVLAAAGLARLGRLSVVTETLDLDRMIPCPGQGAIGVETLIGRPDLQELLAGIDDHETTIAVTTERAFLAAVGGGCSAPVAGHAVVDGDRVTLTSLIGARDGRTIRGSISASVADASGAARALAEQLLRDGGARLLFNDRG